MSIDTFSGSSSTCALTDNTNRYCGQRLADGAMSKADLAICGKLLKKGLEFF